MERVGRPAAKRWEAHVKREGFGSHGQMVVGVEYVCRRVAR